MHSWWHPYTAQVLPGMWHGYPPCQHTSLSNHRAFTEEEQVIMKGLVQVRREACQMDLILYFEMEPLFKIPNFFRKVGNYLSSNCECLMHILAPKTPFLKIIGAQTLVYWPTSRTHSPEL